jgi:hypothetical protein
MSTDTHTPTLDRADYNSPQGIASWWQKDGAWHIALPCADSDPKTGLRTGGFRWTGEQFNFRQDAIAAIERAALAAAKE